MIRSMALAICIAVASPATAQQVERLYPGKAPGSEHWTHPETVRETPDGGQSFTNTRDPELITYLPDPARANGTGVIVLPGGGLRQLGTGGDTKLAIEAMRARGITVFVLKYRTLQIAPPAPGAVPPPRPSGPPSFPKLDIRNGNANPSPNDPALNEVIRLATDDGQAALRRVRARAAALKLDPGRIGMMGFSAGGGVAMGAVIENEPGAVPDFVVSLYGPSLIDVTVHPNAPPLFLAASANHGPVTEGLVALFSIWKRAGKLAELHSYEVPPFAGFRYELWGPRFFDWLAERKLVP